MFGSSVVLFFVYFLCVFVYFFVLRVCFSFGGLRFLGKLGRVGEGLSVGFGRGRGCGRGRWGLLEK